MTGWAQVATFGTTGVGAVAGLLALRQKVVDRPRPEWGPGLAQHWPEGVTANPGVDEYGNEGPTLGCSITNIGDGPAFAVRLSGTDMTFTRFIWPRVESGETLTFNVRFKTEAAMTGMVVLTWHQPPRRGRPRTRKYPLKPS